MQRYLAWVEPYGLTFAMRMAWCLWPMVNGREGETDAIPSIYICYSSSESLYMVRENNHVSLAQTAHIWMQKQ